jgi:hypothetical protein
LLLELLVCQHRLFVSTPADFSESTQDGVAGGDETPLTVVPRMRQRDRSVALLAELYTAVLNLEAIKTMTLRWEVRRPSSDHNAMWNAGSKLERSARFSS